MTAEFDRTLGLGSSDIASVLGIGFISGAELWAIKRGEMPEQEETLRMRVGKLLEPVIAELYEERTGARVDFVNREFWMRSGRRLDVHASTGKPWAYAHLDLRRRGERRIVEGKSVDFLGPGWGDPPDGPIPPKFRAQLQWQMACTGYPVADLALLIGGGRDFRIYGPFERDEPVIEKLVEAGRIYWRHVAEGVPWPVDGSDSSGRYLRAAFPTADEIEKIATAEQELVVEALLAAKDAESAAKKEAAKRAQAVQQLMGPAAVLKGRGFEVTWRNDQPSTETAWESVAKAYRAIAESAILTLCGFRERLEATVAGLRFSAAEPDGFAPLDAIETVHTHTEPGSRRFLPRRKEVRDGSGNG